MTSGFFGLGAGLTRAGAVSYKVNVVLSMRCLNNKTRLAFLFHFCLGSALLNDIADSAVDLASRLRQVQVHHLSRHLRRVAATTVLAKLDAFCELTTSTCVIGRQIRAFIQVMQLIVDASVKLNSKHPIIHAKITYLASL